MGGDPPRRLRGLSRIGPAAETRPARLVRRSTARPRRSAPGRPAPPPSGRRARRRCAGPRPSTASVPTVRITGGPVAPPSVTRISACRVPGRPQPPGHPDHPTGKRRRRAGRRCRPARRATATTSASSAGGTSPASSSASRCRASAGASGVVGDHHAPRAFHRLCHVGRLPVEAGCRAGCSPPSSTAQPLGSRTSATVPPPGRGRRETHPFCRSTIRRTRYSPSPAPGNPPPVTGLALPEPVERPLDVLRADPHPPVGDPERDRPLVGRRRISTGASQAEYFAALVTSSVSTVAGCRRSPSAGAARRGSSRACAPRRSAGRSSPRCAAPRRGRTARPAVPGRVRRLVEESSRSTSRASSLARCPITSAARRRSVVVERLPVLGEGVGVPLDHGDRRTQLVAGHREEEVPVVGAPLLLGDVAEADDPPSVGAGQPVGGDGDPVAVGQLLVGYLARRRWRERQRLAAAPRRRCDR